MASIPTPPEGYKIDLRVNEYGRIKGERFRKRFGFSLDVTGDSKPYLEMHDYLHTVTGAKPTWDDGDELRVVEYEDLIRAGKLNLPKGLRWETLPI